MIFKLKDFDCTNINLQTCYEYVLCARTLVLCMDFSHAYSNSHLYKEFSFTQIKLWPLIRPQFSLVFGLIFPVYGLLTWRSFNGASFVSPHACILFLVAFSILVVKVELRQEIWPLLVCTPTNLPALVCVAARARHLHNNDLLHSDVSLSVVSFFLVLSLLLLLLPSVLHGARQHLIHHFLQAALSIELLATNAAAHIVAHQWWSILLMGQSLWHDWSAFIVVIIFLVNL